MGGTTQDKATPQIDIKLPDDQITGDLTKEFLIHEEQYYALRPVPTKTHNLLSDLKHYRVTLKELMTEVAGRGIEAEIPPQFNQVRVIIEYFDCIIEAKALASYKEILDDANNKADDKKVIQGHRSLIDMKRQQSPKSLRATFEGQNSCLMG